MKDKTMVPQISVSAPSKVILHGEHAVVYGKSAVAASLDLRTRMYLTPIVKENVVQVDFPDVGVRQCWSGENIKEEILKHTPECTSDLKSLHVLFGNLPNIPKFSVISQNSQ